MSTIPKRPEVVTRPDMLPGLLRSLAADLERGPWSVADAANALRNMANTMPAAQSAPEVPSPQAQGGGAVGEVWIDREAWNVAASECLPYDTTLWPARQKAFGGGWHDQVRVAEATPQRAPGVDANDVRTLVDWIFSRFGEHWNASELPDYIIPTVRRLEAALAAPVSAGDGEAIRAKFEAWARPRWGHHPEAFDIVPDRPEPEYNHDGVQAAWAGWCAALTSGASGVDGVALIATERQRQITAEGWTPEHDDEHGGGELAQAAGCYAFGGGEMLMNVHTGAPVSWPWDAAWWKPGDRIRELTKAGALIAAEIDRLQRAAAPAHQGQGERGGAA